MESLITALAAELDRTGFDVTVFAGTGEGGAIRRGGVKCVPFLMEPFVPSPDARADVSMPPERFMAEHHAFLVLGTTLRTIVVRRGPQPLAPLPAAAVRSGLPNGAHPAQPSDLVAGVCPRLPNPPVGHRGFGLEVERRSVGCGGRSGCAKRCRRRQVGPWSLRREERRGRVDRPTRPREGTSPRHRGGSHRREGDRPRRAHPRPVLLR